VVLCWPGSWDPKRVFPPSRVTPSSAILAASALVRSWIASRATWVQGRAPLLAFVGAVGVLACKLARIDVMMYHWARTSRPEEV
jgi:hypothetical protein